MQEQFYTKYPNKMARYIRLLFLVFFLIIVAHQSQAQVNPNLGGVSRMMDRAKAAMDANDFSRANYHFRQIIDGGHTIPADLPYYFAETLYELQQYSNSASFLNKFIQINNDRHELFEKAKVLQKKLEKPLAEIRDCQLCDSKGYRYITCHSCEGEKVTEQECSYCKGKGIIGCSHCAGTGMITKKNIFNIKEFYECERCDGDGRLTCIQCKGSLVETNTCPTCNGKGVLPSDNICAHQTEEEHKAK